MSDSPHPQPGITGASIPTSELSSKLIDLSALLILIPVLLPLVVVFTPSMYFDSDPRASGGLLGAISIGPAGMAYLSVASVAIAAFVLLVSVWNGIRVRWGAFALVALGIVPCLVHLPGHITNRLHGGAWIAAACLGLAVTHLAQIPSAKRMILTALVAMALPLFIQGAWYVYAEHPATVESFMANEQQSIESRGMAFGSTQHAKYLTRLQGNDVIGAVGMSNVLGSILAAITIVSVGCFALSGWCKQRGWRLVVTALCAGLAVWALLLTQSKGALLALSATAGFAVCLLLMLRMFPKVRHAIPAMCVLFVLLGSAAVLIRGAAGPPEDHTGERSLLFRNHYWQGAVQILTDDPTAALVGVGAGKFKDHYEAVRNPISPEVVSSTHNVFVDYIAMLGIGGLAWGLLLIGWICSAGAVIRNDYAGLATRERGPPADKPLKSFGLLAAVVFGIQYYIQFPGLYAETAILWLVGALGFVFIANYIIYPVWSASGAWVNLAAALAACLLMLHAQIEMTFFWPSAAALMWVVTATACTGQSDQSQEKQVDKPQPAWLRFIPAVCLVVLAIALWGLHAEPMARHQAHLAKATNMLRISGPPAALAELDQAAVIIPNDPATTRWRIRLREEIAIALMAHDQPTAASSILDEALAVSEQAEQAGLDGLSAARRHGTLTLGAYYITENVDWLRQARDAYTKVIELSPHSLNDHVRLADIHWDLGDFDAAQAAYKRALEISDQFYLDPDVQLPEEERRRIETRITG